MHYYLINFLYPKNTSLKALQELSDKFDAQEERIAKLEDIIKINNLI